MAKATAKSATKTDAVNVDVETNIVTEEVQKELDLGQQVTVKSIANWLTGFARKTSQGDVSIPPKGMIRLTRNEIISQAQSGNKLLAGENLDGNHPTLIICDDATNEYLGFVGKTFYSDDLVDELFAIKTQAAFEDAVKDKIVTRAEKHAIMVTISKKGYNDYSKIHYLEGYTGFTLDKIKATV